MYVVGLWTLSSLQMTTAIEEHARARDCAPGRSHQTVHVTISITAATAEEVTISAIIVVIFIRADRDLI